MVQETFKDFNSKNIRKVCDSNSPSFRLANEFVGKVHRRYCIWVAALNSPTAQKCKDSVRPWPNYMERELCWVSLAFGCKNDNTKHFNFITSHLQKLFHKTPILECDLAQLWNREWFTDERIINKFKEKLHLQYEIQMTWHCIVSLSWDLCQPL